MPRLSSHARGYNARWRSYRARYLRDHPLCRACAKAGLVAAASVVDHITPHKGDHALFWDPTNHQPLCGSCHNSDKQRAEKSGAYTYRGTRTDGTPLDPGHHWNRPARGEVSPAGDRVGVCQKATGSGHPTARALSFR